MADRMTTSADPTIDKPPRRRRRWPVALKIFGGVLLVLGVCSGWILWRGYRQLVAIEKIEGSVKWGVRIVRIDRLGSPPVVTDPVGPMWFRKRLGGERMRMFDRVTEVNLDLSSRDPELLQEIGRWSDVSSLTIQPDAKSRLEFIAKTPAEVRNSRMQLAKSNRTSGCGFEHLRGLTNLKILDIYIPNATDRDFDWLERAPNLVELHIEDAAITDATAIPIGKLSRLEYLSLPNTLIGAEGLRSIGALTNLDHLELSATRVSDAGLAHLKNLTALNHLDLDLTEITDAGLVHLQDLNLQSLYVAHTKITIDGLIRIRKLKNLKSLSINKCNFTTPAYLEFKLLYSDLSISWTED